MQSGVGGAGWLKRPRDGLRILLAGFCLVAYPAGAAPVEWVEQADAWLRLRLERQREHHAWEARKRELDTRIELLEHEKRLLTERLADLKQASEIKAEDQRRREQRLTQREQALEAAEERINEVAAQFAVAPDRETAWVLPDTLSVGERLREILARALTVQRRQQSTWLERRTLETPLGPLRMDVLNMGFSQAYAVSPDGRQAGHAVWTGTQWHWSWDPGLSGPIKHAIRMHQADQSPRWIALPVRLAEEQP